MLVMVRVCAALVCPRDKLPKDKEAALSRAAGPITGSEPGGRLKTAGGAMGLVARIALGIPDYGSTW